MSLTEATPLAGAALASHQYSDWTQDREVLLRQLWGVKGWSARRIAAEIGGFEQCVDGGKCAVIGKARRLGLVQINRSPNTRPMTPRIPKPKTHHTAAHLAKRRAEAVQMPSERALPEPAPPVFSATPCSLEELDDTKCHWPIGEPGTPEFHFCGGGALDRAPYCMGHMRVAYTVYAPAKPRAVRTQTGWG
jgi:GcrA cell cycle regulator